MALMVDGAEIRDFWSQWNHEPNPTQEFKTFRIRMTEVAMQLWEDYFQRKDYEDRRKAIAVISGTPCGTSQFFQQSGFASLLTQAKNLFEVATALQYLLWTLERVSEGGFNDCCSRLQYAIEISPTIMIRLVRRGTKAILYPSGARLLDESVVETNLIWLARHPAVLKPFEEALKIYMAKDPKQYRSMLDSLRFSLEQMVRIVLNNQKSLENQKEEFLRWLSAHGVHVHIGSMYHELLFGGFSRYQNEAVKHQEDQYAEAEVEFVLYATGTFLRLIQRLLEQDDAFNERKA